MKSIERRFASVQQKNPCWSSLVCFSKAVLGRGFKPQTISRHFHKLVDKNDFSNSDKNDILIQLYFLSDHFQDDGNRH